MRQTEFVDLVRRRIVQTAVGASAMRSQGKGVVGAARRALEDLELRRFRVKRAKRFAAVLDEETEVLRKKLPPGSQNWGTARKALNLFLRDCLYTKVTAEHYGLDRLTPWLELPMDSFTARGILGEASEQELPRWKGVKYHTPEDNAAFQAAAANIAEGKGIERVHLDLLFWRSRES